jgi:hypothetical protein
MLDSGKLKLLSGMLVWTKARGFDHYMLQSLLL